MENELVDITTTMSPGGYTEHAPKSQAPVESILVLVASPGDELTLSGKGWSVTAGHLWDDFTATAPEINAAALSVDARMHDVNRVTVSLFADSIHCRCGEYLVECEGLASFKAQVTYAGQPFPVRSFKLVALPREPWRLELAVLSKPASRMTAEEVRALCGLPPRSICRLPDLES